MYIVKITKEYVDFKFEFKNFIDAGTFAAVVLDHSEDELTITIEKKKEAEGQ